MPPGHPEFQRLRLLRLQAEADDYRLQKERLCELCRDRASPHFVATYLTAPDPRTGQVASFCAWGEGAPALLPRAEKVCFTRRAPGGEHQVVALGEWERVRSVAGELMTPTGWYPERYRVEQFPGPAQLAAIGSAPA